MNSHVLEEIARQQHADTRAWAERQRAAARPREQHPPLRVRTGWTLVHLGLKLAIPDQRQPVKASAARSLSGSRHAQPSRRPARDPAS